MSFKSSSPSVNWGILVGATPCFDTPTNHTSLPALVQCNGMTYSCSTLIDSGSEGDFLDSTMARSWGIPAIPLSSPITVQSLNGFAIMSITHSTLSVSLIVSGNHSEVITFYLFDSLSAPVVLGHPWLTKHNPHINWLGNSVLSWSPSCLGPAPCPGSVSHVLQVERVYLSGVPAMDKYIRESLEADLICPSSSPAEARFFAPLN